jgi:hypothetical protein
MAERIVAQCTVSVRAIPTPAANHNIRRFAARLNTFRFSPGLTKVDRSRFLAESVCDVLMASPTTPVKKGLYIVVAVVLAPVLLVGFSAFAAGDWRPVGSTPAGDQVLVSSVTTQKNGLRTAWIRVEYKEPARLPQGGPFAELRARVRFNCASGGAVPSSEWFYSRDRGGKLVVSKKTHHDDQFGQMAEGGFGELARNFVCNQK